MGHRFNPCPGRFHMWLSNYVHVPQLLNRSSRAHKPQLYQARMRQLLCATTTEVWAPTRLETVLCNKRSRSPRWEAQALQQRVAPTSPNHTKPKRSSVDPAQPPNKIITIFFLKHMNQLLKKYRWEEWWEREVRNVEKPWAPFLLQTSQFYVNI